MLNETTIAAISTPIGTGGISIVRVSGKNALQISKKVFEPYNTSVQIEPRYMNLGTFTTAQFKEKCMMVWFKAPHSYTGEDIVEFQCHGGIVIAQGILNTLLNCGATLAEPGEFTKRAFLNGKITLDEAEGVMDMINAESDTEVKAGYNLMSGELCKQITTLQDDITTLIASVDVTFDYPEEDYEEKTSNEVLQKLTEISARLSQILSTSKTGMLIKNGTRVLILGKPNVGKSSLLNAMLNYDRAIVTAISGTTRDTIIETYLFNGAKFILTDTAGLRESSDVVEKIGIEKSKQAINQSDIVLLVLDASEKLSQEDKDIIKLIKDKLTIVVLNKTDLPQKIDLSDYNFKNIMKISALNKLGIDTLKQKIYNLVIDDTVLSTNVLITNIRHEQALTKALDYCSSAIDGINKKFSLDLVSVDLNNMWLALGEITGQNSNEEIIDRIFTRFCLGK